MLGISATLSFDSKCAQNPRACATKERQKQKRSLGGAVFFHPFCHVFPRITSCIRDSNNARIFHTHEALMDPSLCTRKVRPEWRTSFVDPVVVTRHGNGKHVSKPH